MIDWNKGPALGNDFQEFEVGDYVLALVKVRTTYTKPNYVWEPYLLVASETGWDYPDGDPWSMWEWEDVSYWAKLDEDILPSLTGPEE